MPRNKKESNVVPFVRKAPKLPDLEKVELAIEKLQEGDGLSDEKQIAKAHEALKISADCTPAHVFLADRATSDAERIEHMRRAVSAAERLLGPDWETRYKGVFWVDHDTRPVMRCMIKLAFTLQLDGELDEALTLYRKLLEMCPDDNIGARYLLAPCLYEAEKHQELEKLLADNDDDDCAVFAYTKALHLFRKSGKSAAAKKALLKAFKINPYVPIFLSDIVEMPESTGSVGIGDESEAGAYVEDHGYLWDDTEGAVRWFADVLEPELLQHFDDTEMVHEVLKELRFE